MLWSPPCHEFSTTGCPTAAVALDRSAPLMEDSARYTNGLPQVRLNHDTLERLDGGLLPEHMHPADGSVQDDIDKAPRCYSRCS
jgi:hypothetical protein